MPTQLKHIPKLRFKHPRSNLPRHTSQVQKENKFAIEFARQYLEQNRIIHGGTSKTSIELAREIGVNGLGIADIVAVAWIPRRGRRPSKPRTVRHFLRECSPSVRAFEIKITDWRKGLMQAHRYRYFAHVAIVVVPPSAASIARKYLDTFKRLKVGLWSFDMDSKKINTFYSPRRKDPMTFEYKCKAVELVGRASRSPHFS